MSIIQFPDRAERFQRQTDRNVRELERDLAEITDSEEMDELVEDLAEIIWHRNVAGHETARDLVCHLVRHLGFGDLVSAWDDEYPPANASFKFRDEPLTLEDVL